MRKGPRTKPTELEKYQGNPGHKTKAELRDSLQPVLVTDLTPPDCLDAAAKTEWDRVAPRLIKYKVLSELDRNALALYCQSWSDYVALSETLRQTGVVYETNGQIKPRPEVAMKRNAWLEVIRVSSEFGLTPSSRAGMQLNFNAVRKSTAELLDELDFDQTDD